MVALNFSAEFAEAVRSGRKRQTVRLERTRPIIVGNGLQLYTGLRTKGARKLGDAVCTETFRFSIDQCLDFFADNRLLHRKEANLFAYSDGFDDQGAMLDWFMARYPLPFRGVCIRWRLAT